jgi:serine phosphatase RsbU (regulator of sigma subunit)
LGAIQLDTQNRARKFTAEDLPLLGTIANLASLAVEKARMHEKALQAEKERRSSEIAKSVQLGLLPQMEPVLDGYCFYAHYSPAEAVGGDYYDFVPLPGGRLAIVVGDVSGKGVPGAILMAKLSSEVKFSLAAEANLANAVTKLNDQMIRGGLGHRFITLTAMVLDPIAHQITVVNAGHPKPKIYRDQHGTLTEILSDEIHGFPIGFEAGYRYRATYVVMDPGDTITLFTDGVTDARNRYGEMFGADRVDRYLVPDSSFPLDYTRPKLLGERLVTEIRRHVGNAPQYDDIAIVCFCRLEQERVTHTHFPRAWSGSLQIPPE